ncbi:hypothetical protein Hanom_Chr05g00417981 [Helianthus anomalus]
MLFYVSLLFYNLKMVLLQIQNLGTLRSFFDSLPDTTATRHPTPPTAIIHSFTCHQKQPFIHSHTGTNTLFPHHKVCQNNTPV